MTIPLGGLRMHEVEKLPEVAGLEAILKAEPEWTLYDVVKRIYAYNKTYKDDHEALGITSIFDERVDPELFDRIAPGAQNDGYRSSLRDEMMGVFNTVQREWLSGKPTRNAGGLTIKPDNALRIPIPTWFTNFLKDADNVRSHIRNKPMKTSVPSVGRQKE